MAYFVMFLLGALNAFLWAFSTVDNSELQKMSSQCEKNGGYEKAIIDSVRINVYCKDGAKFQLKD